MSDATERVRLLEKVLAQYRLRLQQGESFADSAVIAEFPALMPELASELKKIRLVHNARLAAEKTSAFGVPDPVMKPPSASSDTPTTTHAAKKNDAAPSSPSEPSLSPRGVPTTVRYFGDYELQEELGRGGMGIVYKARQVSLNRLVAIKMLLSGTMASDEEVNRFYSEAEAAGNLEHPNIVSIHEVGEHHGTHYFSMAYVRGRSLHELLRDGPLPARKAAQYLAKVAAAIAYAHERGVLHRDIKPHNILIGENDEPHVTDFGLAKRTAGVGEMTASGQVLGTPSYMPPEQALADRERLGPRSDVYSLGATLYACLTGRPPFQADTAAHVIMQVLGQDPVSPRTLVPQVDQDLETICLKCLEKEPANRYASCGELVEELQRWLRGEPIVARPLSSIQRSWKWCRRNPALAITGTAVVASIVLGASISLAFGLAANSSAKQAKQALTLQQQETERAEGEKKKAQAETSRAERETELAKMARDAEKRERDLANRHLYTAHMNMAQSAWEVSHIDQTARLIDLYRPPANPARDQEDLRGFEWYYWHRKCHLDLLTLIGHERSANDVAFSPDSKQLASASSDKTVRVWDIASGRETLTLRGHTNEVYCVAYSPDGKRLASASFDKTVKVWDAATGHELLTFRGHGSIVTSVAFSPDGKQLASASGDKTVKVWDAATGDEKLSLSNQEDKTGVFCVAYSPDGKRIASAGYDPMIRIWDSITGEELLALVAREDKTALRVFGLAFSADGKQLASAGENHMIQVWDMTTGQKSQSLTGHAEGVNRVAFRPDGKQLASASSDGTIKTWDLNTGQELLTLRGHIYGVRSVAYSPDGQRLASSGQDQTVKLWNANKSQETLTMWGHAARFPLDVYAITFSSDGKKLASANYDYTVSLWDSSVGHEMFTLNGHTRSVRSVAFSPDETRLASASEDGTVKVWNLAQRRELLSLKGNAGSVFDVAFSPDGKKLATANMVNLVKLWDAATGQELKSFEGHTSWVYCVAFSPDGKYLASGSYDRTIRLWDVATGKTMQVLKGHSLQVSKLAFSKDGKRLASASWDLTVKIWDLAAAKETITLVGHSDLVESVAFSPDDKRLASAGWDQTTKVWDTDTGQETLTLKGHASTIYSLAYSPDGKRLASASRIDSIRIWDATPVDDSRVDRLVNRSSNTRPHPSTFSDYSWGSDAPKNQKAKKTAANSASAAPGAGQRPSGAAPNQQRQLNPPPEFRLAANGLGGVAHVEPVTWKKEWVEKDQFAHMKGAGEIKFREIGNSNFALEIDLTFNSGRGTLSIFAGHDLDTNAWIPFDVGHDSQDPQKIVARIWNWMNEGRWCWGDYQAKTGERLNLTFLANEGRYRLFRDGAHLLSGHGAPQNVQLRLKADGQELDVVIHRCLLRPLTKEDCQRMGLTEPTTNLKLDPAKSLAELKKRTESLGPVPETGKPFQAATTQTPFSWIEPGTFWMGSAQEKPSSPGHYQVKLTKGFWTSQYEITQREWALYSKTDPSRQTGSPALPVHNVKWTEAIAFCRWLNDKERSSGKFPADFEYRLPTEAEWEYAARAGRQGNLPGSDGECWSQHNAEWRTHEVGEKLPNAWNLYDMLGNVPEWCLDAWTDYPAVGSETVDPFTPVTAIHQRRILRGGSWWMHDSVNAQDRYSHYDVAGGYRGFRIVLGTKLMHKISPPLLEPDPTVERP